MALIKCPECGKENVYDGANTCPNCGFPIKEHFEKIKQEQEFLEEKQREKKAINERLKKRLEEIDGMEHPYKPSFVNVVLGTLVLGFFSAICFICIIYGAINDDINTYEGLFFLFAGVCLSAITYTQGKRMMENYKRELHKFENWEQYKERLKYNAIDYSEDLLHDLKKQNPQTPQKQPTASPSYYSENMIHCPKCGSTSISTGARGVNHFWGFIGASKTVNRCAKCGHMWTPKG